MALTNKKIFKAAVIIILLFAVAISVFFAFNHKKNIAFEENTLSSFSLSDFGEYKYIHCQEANSGAPLFPEKTCLAIVGYDKACFLTQLQAIESSYIFLDEPVLYDDGEHCIIPSPEFSIGDWDFKIIAGEAYPNYIDMIAVNKSKCEIAYLSYVDTDRDFLCLPNDNDNDKFMKSFVEGRFRYKFS